MASKKQSKMPLRKNYKSDKAFENAMLKYMIKLEPEMFGFKVTQREQMNKGGMMKKKGYAKGGTVSKNQPMTMDWFRKSIGTAEGRRLIGSGGGTGSSNSPSMILKKLMEKNAPTFKIDMSSKKKMIEKIKEMQGKKTAKAAKGGMMKKKGYAMGGMMPTQERKINPTTGMTMKDGGMLSAIEATELGRSKMPQRELTLVEKFKRKKMREKALAKEKKRKERDKNNGSFYKIKDSLRNFSKTGTLSLNKGGMIDMRKSGMFSKGGVIKKSRKR